MKESLKPNPSEQLGSAEHEATTERSTGHNELSKEYEQPSKEVSPSEIENLRDKIEQHSKSGQDYETEAPAKEPGQPLYVNGELKSLAYHRVLNRARAHLGLPGRFASRIIHQPVIDKISDIGEKTIARPTGLLLAGITAFIGSSLLLYFSKSYGFEFSFAAIFVLFGVGYIIGLLIDLVVLAKKSKH